MSLVTPITRCFRLLVSPVLRRILIVWVAVAALPFTTGCGADVVGGSTECGNGALERELGEECDGERLDGRSCESLGLEAGTLSCGEDCRYQVQGCLGFSDCGNGRREYPEQCDGQDFGDLTCQSLGVASGQLVCVAGCSAVCSADSTDLCGDGLIVSPEACDDGNVSAGDGCDASCLMEADWICRGEPSICQPCADRDGDGYGAGVGCAGPDCNDASALINPVALETCNGRDDNCDGQVDEASDDICYDGPAGSAGVGICQQGVSYCVAGRLGPCVGQIIPIAEACNRLDDDCDGLVDQSNPTLSCGIGACANSTPSCVLGVLQTCQPHSASTEQCGDNIDNDCDGAVDEGCNCIYVSPQGSDSASGLQSYNAVLTINEGLLRAQLPGAPKQLCVAAWPGCGWYSYAEDIVMVDGISIYGSYDPQTWQRSCPMATNLRANNHRGTYAGPGITSPTVLDGFELELQLNVGNRVAVVTVDGASGLILSNNYILGSFTGVETFGVHVINGGAPLIYDSAIQGGHGSDLRVGVYSQDSRPIIRKNCHTADLDSGGRCKGNCGRISWGDMSILASRPTWPNPMPPSERTYGIWLERSPGAVVDQSAACGGGGQIESAGVRVTGDASGTLITRNYIGAGGSPVDAGIWLKDCAGAAPWIGDNYHIWSGGDNSGTAQAAGIRSFGDCHPLIEANLEIAGAYEGSSDDTAGIHCGRSAASGVSSRCAVIGNFDVKGSNFGFPLSSTGLRCSDGACSLVRGNYIRGRGGMEVRGIYFDRSTSVMVDQNLIEGGCGNLSIGILAEDAGGRVENNVIWAGTCNTGGASGGFFGAWIRTATGVNELDVHSNWIHGGGLPMNCLSYGLALGVVSGTATPLGPLGIYRNNIIDAGLCLTAWGVAELDAAADPRFFEHNDVLWPGISTALYRDESTVDLMDATSINGLTDCTSSGNIAADPLLTAPPGTFGNLGAGSPCINRGSLTGMPAQDYEGDSRPAAGLPDIGPDER